MNTIKRDNTITLDFKNITKKPMGLILLMIKENLKINVNDVLCIQLDHIKNKVYIKLCSKAKVAEVLQTCTDGLFFVEEGEGKEICIKEELRNGSKNLRLSH